MEKIDICALQPDVFWKLDGVCAPLNTENFKAAFFYAALYHATNCQRIKHGLPQLLYSKLFKSAAILHSNEMKTHRFFAHNNPYNPKLKDALVRVYAVGGAGAFNIVGENIADFPLISSYSYTTNCFGFRKKILKNSINTETYKSMALRIVDGWMNSPGHRKNILNNRFTHVGFGMALHNKTQDGGEFDYLLCTQNFGG